MEDIRQEDLEVRCVRARNPMLHLVDVGFFVTVRHKPTGVTITEYSLSSVEARLIASNKVEQVLKASGLYF